MDEANPQRESSCVHEEEVPPKFDTIMAVEDDSSGHLTIGFEIEVLFPTLPSEQAPDPHSNHHGEIYKGKGQVHAATEQERSMDEDEDEDDEEAAFDQWLLSFLRRILPGEKIRLEKDDELYHPHDDIPMYDAWRVTQDHSVQFYEELWQLSQPQPQSQSTTTATATATSTSTLMPSAYNWKGREITSEILDANDFTERLTKTYLICHALRLARVHINSTTSVHVHIGRGNSTFSLLTLKKFATLLWLTDDAILGLQDDSRQNNEYCQAVNAESTLAHTPLEVLQAQNASLSSSVDQQRETEAQMREFLPEKLCEEQDKLLPAQVRRIWGATTVEEIATLMACPDTISERGSVGFRRFLPAGKTGGNTHTLKWRQMSGCLDVWPIVHWMDFCLKFTNFARASDAVKYKSAIGALMGLDGGEAFTGLNLLEAFGLREARAYFGKRVQEYDEGCSELYKGEKDGELFLEPLDWWKTFTKAS